MLNLIYVTSRKEPMLECFLDSLAVECQGDFSTLKIIIVDYWANPFRGTKAMHEARRQYVTDRIDAAGIPHESFNWTSPKINPWQGPHRQTCDDWFNVANSRNTGLCYCDDGWVAFIDDLSVLMPGWLAGAAKAAMHPKSITLCRYRKVRELVVERGVVKSFTPMLTAEGKDLGEDSRQKHCRNLDRPMAPVRPEWHFGYVVGPVEAYLDVNGWVETDTAGLSFEDVPTGINLGKMGYGFRYDPTMVAYESEEGHSQPFGMKRADYGPSPRDKSHAVLDHVRAGNGFCSRNNFFNGMTLRQLRDHVYAKASNAFPAPPAAMREWFTGRLLSDPNLTAPYPP